MKTLLSTGVRQSFSLRPSHFTSSRQEDNETGLFNIIHHCAKAKGVETELAIISNMIKKHFRCEEIWFGQILGTLGGKPKQRDVFYDIKGNNLDKSKNTLKRDALLEQTLSSPLKAIEWPHSNQETETSTLEESECVIACAFKEYLQNQPATVISLIIDSESSCPIFKMELQYLLPHLHRFISRLTFTEARTDEDLPALTSREIEVLRWVGYGKNTWDISMLLNITERTVKFHLKNTFDKLNVVSRAQAIAVALNNGIIKL